MKRSVVQGHRKQQHVKREIVESTSAVDRSVLSTHCTRQSLTAPLCLYVLPTRHAMAGSRNYGDRYGSGSRAMDPAWSRPGNASTGYVFQEPPQPPPGFYVQRWTSQGPPLTNHHYGEGAQPAFAEASSTQVGAGNEWPARAYPDLDLRSMQAPPGNVLPGQVQQRMPHVAERHADQTSFRQSNRFAPHEPMAAQSGRETQSLHRQVAPDLQPGVERSEQRDANGDQHQRLSQDGMSPAVGHAAMQSTAGQKRKRSGHDASQPDHTPHRGSVAKSVGEPDNASPSTSSDVQAGAPGEASKAQSAVQPPDRTANDARLTGSSIESAIRMLRTPYPLQTYSSDRQTPDALVPDGTVRGPNYGRRRINGRWVSIPVSNLSRPAGVPQPAQATPLSHDLLSTQQIEALQNAKSQPQHDEEAQDDEEPGANDETAPDLGNEASGDASTSDKDVGRWKTMTGPLLEEHGRQFNTLAGTIGSYIHYSNKIVRYNAIVDDLDEIREKLFLVEKPILLNSQQIADYWPHMTNIWMRSQSRDTDEHGVTEEAWECRHRRRIKGVKIPRTSKGDRHRLSKRHMIEKADACRMRIRLTHYTKHADTKENHKTGFGACKCIPEWMHLRRTDKIADHEHNHDIDMLDRFRRSDGIMYFTKLKAEEGFSYAGVAHWIHEKYDNVTKQALYMTKQEVANVASQWRRANRDVELRDSPKDWTPEEQRKVQCLDLAHTTKSEGLIRALAAVFERLPEAIEMAMPVLEANRVHNVDAAVQGAAIAEGDKIVAPFPGFPWFRRGPHFNDIELSAIVNAHAQQRAETQRREAVEGGPPPPPQQSQTPTGAPHRPGPVTGTTHHVPPGPAWTLDHPPPRQPPPMPHHPPAGHPPPPPPHHHMGPLRPHYAPPPGPALQHNGGPVYHGGAGPHQAHDAYERHLHCGARIQHGPNGQSTLAPRPPMGPSIPPPGPQPTFRPPYQVSAADSGRPQPDVPPPNGLPHQRREGPLGQPSPLGPPSHGTHPVVNDPRDPDAWRPSWLQPLEKEKDVPSEGGRDAPIKLEPDVEGANGPVETQLQDELGGPSG